MFEWFGGLFPLIGKLLLKPFDFQRVVLCKHVEFPQHVFDALDSANGILRIDVRRYLARRG